MLTRRERTPLRKLMFLGAMAGAGALVEDTATGNPLTFIMDKSKPLKSLLIPFTPRQSGTGDPSPDNIRPILPWDGLTVFGGGKNLFDETDIKYSGYILQDNGTITGNQNYNVSDYLFLKAGTYSVGFDNYNAPSQNTTFRICCYGAKSASDFIQQVYSGSPLAMDQRIEARFTLTTDCYILVSWRKTHTNIMLEVGSSASSYEEYKPIIETDIVFPSPVYGGAHEAVSGAMTEKWYCLKKKWSEGENTTVYANFTRKSFRFPVSVMGVNGSYFSGQLCNVAKLLWDTAQKVHFYIDTSVAYIWLPNDTDGNTEIQFASRLVTPQEQMLTGHQITAIKGQNTLWSDANGSMTTVFLKKG